MTALLRPLAAPTQKSGPEYYWRLIKKSGPQGFTVNELYAKTRGVTRSTVKGYVQILRSAGVVEALGSERGEDPQARQATRYGLRPPVPRIAPSGRRPTKAERLKGRKQQQLWNVLRGLSHFTVTRLAVSASTDEIEVGIPTARTYVGALLKAGLVVEVQPMACVPHFRAGFTAATLRLLPAANTGPAPLRVIGNRIFDPNTSRNVGSPLDDGEDVTFEPKVSA